MALLFYLFFDSLTSLYLISAMFGLFQGGIVPSYAIIVREAMPAREAATRVGIVILASVIGMSLGGWISGVIFDATGSYAAAFLNGIGLERRQRHHHGRAAAARQAERRRLAGGDGVRRAAALAAVAAAADDLRAARWPRTGRDCRAAPAIVWGAAPSAARAAAGGACSSMVRAGRS